MKALMICKFRLSFKERINLLRQLIILVSDSPGAVRGETDCDLVVRIGPIGMMVLFFSNYCHRGHEAKGRDKIAEFKHFDDGAIVLGPT